MTLNHSRSKYRRTERGLVLSLSGHLRQSLFRFIDAVLGKHSEQQSVRGFDALLPTEVGNWRALLCPVELLERIDVPLDVLLIGLNALSLAPIEYVSSQSFETVNSHALQDHLVLRVGKCFGFHRPHNLPVC